MIYWFNFAGICFIIIPFIWYFLFSRPQNPLLRLFVHLACSDTITRTQSKHSLLGFSALWQRNTHIFLSHGCHSGINSRFGIKVLDFSGVKCVLKGGGDISLWGHKSSDKLWAVESGICLAWTTTGKAHARLPYDFQQPNDLMTSHYVYRKITIY